MCVATLVIPGRDWAWPVAIFLGIALFALAWAYRRAPARGAIRGICSALKLIGLLVLAACLLDPLWSGQRARPGANMFVIVADNSQGMQIKDRGAMRSRGELLRAMLTADKADWRAKLDENFQVRRYLFDSRLQNTRDFSELRFDGRASAIGSALRTIADRYRGQPLAGVLLLTDGNATDITEGKTDLAGLPPVYPVVIGRDDAIKDISLQKVTVSQTVFEDAPVTVQADVLADGYSGSSIVAQVLDRNGKKVAEQAQRAPRDGETVPFRMQLRPEKGGVTFYRLRVAAKEELQQFEKPETSTEATLANNSRVLVVDRGQGPYRILYVSGRPNWEYKFLHRAVEEDGQIQLAALIRIAKREPKFDFRGRSGESSNPLFRGFSNQSKEEIERYDQPVLVRIYPDDASKARDEPILRGGFPRTPEDLYDYHAIIVDDLEAEFFTRDQMALLQRFVSERGGGFLMLGGAESFHQGRYERTPIGDMLPVYLDHVAETRPSTNLHMTLTREGWLQPWARLRSNETDEQSRLGAMPPFQVLNRVRDIKPGASVIATVSDENGRNFPALAVQRFGNGRVGAMMIGDVWRWGLRDEASHRDMDKAWRQLARWLVADVPNRVELTVEPERGDPNQALRLRVRA
ncbi:MAG TPA: glutamine amidotransferase, partial [Candidatus Angelobacter sp.]|nr:glutamine amidotransferase [Candidatus Angelobacter sp.]